MSNNQAYSPQTFTPFAPGPACIRAHACSQHPYHHAPAPLPREMSPRPSIFSASFPSIGTITSHLFLSFPFVHANLLHQATRKVSVGAGITSLEGPNHVLFYLFTSTDHMALCIVVGWLRHIERVDNTYHSCFLRLGEFLCPIGGPWAFIILSSPSRHDLDLLARG